MNLRDSDGSRNFPLFSSSGVLKPPHPAQLRGAYLMLMKLENMVTLADGEDGIALGGAAISDRRIAREMGVERSTVKAWRERLVKYRYVTTRKLKGGFSYRVHKSKRAVLISSAKRVAGNQATPRREIPPPLAGNRATYKEEKAEREFRKQKQHAAAPLHPAWKAVGFAHPAGPPNFRRLWESIFDAQGGESVIALMGRCCDEWQAIGERIPAPFAKALSNLRVREREHERTTNAPEELARL